MCWKLLRGYAVSSSTLNLFWLLSSFHLYFTIYYVLRSYAFHIWNTRIYLLAVVLTQWTFLERLVCWCSFAVNICRTRTYSLSFFRSRNICRTRNYSLMLLRRDHFKNEKLFVDILSSDNWKTRNYLFDVLTQWPRSHFHPVASDLWILMSLKCLPDARNLKIYGKRYCKVLVTWLLEGPTVQIQ